MEYNLKGVEVRRVNTWHECQYEGCKRVAYYKFKMGNAVGKAFMECFRTFKWKAPVYNKDGSPKHNTKGEVIYKEEMLLTGHAGYFCSFDCARKYILTKTFEAKVPLTPLVRDFLGQGEVPISDSETIVEGPDTIFEGFDKRSYLKISPNSFGDHPFLLDVSVGGRNFPVRLNKEGVQKIISGLQLLLDQEDKII